MISASRLASQLSSSRCRYNSFLIRTFKQANCVYRKDSADLERHLRLFGCRNKGLDNSKLERDKC